MKKTLTKTVVKPAIFTKLEALNHETIGSMADNLGIFPAIVRQHIKQQSPVTTKFDWLKEIQRVLNLDTFEEITTSIKCD